MWFPDLDMAEREAREIAAEIASKLGIKKGGRKRVGVCIRDHHKRIQREIVVSDEAGPSAGRQIDVRVVPSSAQQQRVHSRKRPLRRKPLSSVSP